MKCGECEYWDLDGCEENDYEVLCSRCIRFPPVYIGIDKDQDQRLGMTRFYDWPWTSEAENCGEWKKRSKAKK